LALVKVDSQRRIYIPKKFPFKAKKAIIIPYGMHFYSSQSPKKSLR